MYIKALIKDTKYKNLLNKLRKFYDTNMNVELKSKKKKLPINV